MKVMVSRHVMATSLTQRLVLRLPEIGRRGDAGVTNTYILRFWSHELGFGASPGPNPRDTAGLTQISVSTPARTIAVVSPR